MPRKLAPDAAALVDHLAPSARLHAVTEPALVSLDVALSDSFVHG